MMGGGSFRQGSTVPSSTLSPFVPPFTVNRSALEHQPNVPSHVFDDQYDGAWIRSHLGNCLHPHSPNPNPISDSLAYMDSNIELVRGHGQLGTQWTASLCPRTYGLPYGQESESTATNVVEADSYCPQYCSAIHDNNSAVLNKSGYGLLDFGIAAPLEESPQTSYSHNVPDYWLYGLGKDVDASLSWKEPEGKFSSHFRSSLQMDASATEGFSASREAVSAWHGKSVESSAGVVHNGLVGTVPERLDDKCLANSDTSASIPSFNTPITSVLVPSIQETTFSHMLDPSVVKTQVTSNQNASCEGCLAYASCPAVPTINPSMISQPSQLPGGSGSLRGGIGLKGMKSYNQPYAINNKDSVGQVSVKVQSPMVALIANTGKNNNATVKDDHTSLESSLLERGLPVNQKSKCDNSLNDLSKKEFELKLTGLKHPKVSNCSLGTDGLGDSIQRSSDAHDQFISAVDSPCWKGAFRHSPFTVIDAEAPISQGKELEGCSDFSQQNQSRPVNADGSEVVSAPKPFASLNNHETRSVENSSFSKKHPTVLCSLYADAEKAGLDCYKSGCEDGAQYPDGLLNRGSGFELYKSSETVSGVKTPDLIPLSREDKVVTSANEPMPQARIEELVMAFNTAKEDSSDLCSHDKERVSNPFSSEGPVLSEVAEIFRASDMSSQHSVPRLDTSTLVKTIHNISELLKSSHCGDANALNENDYEVIRLAINNLGGLLRPLSKSTIEIGSSCSTKKSSDPPKTIENVVSRNICGQEEHHLQTLLYKNLWIEAEARLCSVKYELQLALMEIEMGKSKKSSEATDLQNSCATLKTIDRKNLLGVSAMSGISGKETSAFGANKDSHENTIRKGSYSNALEMNQSGNYEQAEDVEASVMARFRVLKCRDHYVA